MKKKKKVETERNITPLYYLSDFHWSTQKGRIQAENRLRSLRKLGRTDPLIERLCEDYRAWEKSLEQELAREYKSHCCYPWTSRILGCGLENVPKILGIIEGWRFASTGRCGIAAFDNPSAFRRVFGWAVIDGHVEKLKKGKQIHYNPKLKALTWRLIGNLMKANAVWHELFLKIKSQYIERLTRECIKIIPTPPGAHYCPECEEVVKGKNDIEFCPRCESELITKKEPPGYCYEGHLKNMALAKVAGIWITCLWVVWRTAEGLPVTQPWIITHGGHTGYIDPWDMVDR